ncbi:hypothetical protein [Pedobacter sp. GR22-6]|uniref:hypothetical protein n=1 Tax=Pedobacter sp. GR22-6 TaxID=3127957 RepID=UPI00307FABCD
MKDKIILPLSAPQAQIVPVNNQPEVARVERTLSFLAGGWLLYQSLKKMAKFPVIGLQGLATSGFLLYRGATGQWPSYHRLQRITGLTAAETPTVVMQVLH